jgi:hypothetical protein
LISNEPLLTVRCVSGNVQDGFIRMTMEELKRSWEMISILIVMVDFVHGELVESECITMRTA